MGTMQRQKRHFRELWRQDGEKVPSYLAAENRCIEAQREWARGAAERILPSAMTIYMAGPTDPSAPHLLAAVLP